MLRIKWTFFFRPVSWTVFLKDMMRVSTFNQLWPSPYAASGIRESAVLLYTPQRSMTFNRYSNKRSLNRANLLVALIRSNILLKARTSVQEWIAFPQDKSGGSAVPIRMRCICPQSHWTNFGLAWAIVTSTQLVSRAHQALRKATRHWSVCHSIGINERIWGLQLLSAVLVRYSARSPLLSRS